MKRIISLLLALLLIMNLTGCGETTQKDAHASDGNPTVQPTTLPTEIPTEEPTGAPTESPSEAPVDPSAEPKFLSEENLANTRWVATLEKVTLYDGTITESDLYGFGYELFLFADGSAQLLTMDAADRRPLSDPYGNWKLSEEKLVFSRTEDNTEDIEEYFREEAGLLIWERYEGVEVWMEPAEMTQGLTPLTPEDLVGAWQLEFMTADGCDYSIEELQFDSSMCIGLDAEGAPVLEDYYSTEFNKKRLKNQPLPILWDETPEASGWAPWVAELPAGKNIERSLIYLGCQDLLYVENLYYMDGAPAVALYRYRLE